jgi:hypothetical protein
MKKLNKEIYNKLLLEVAEAKDQGLVKLANGVAQSLPSEVRNEGEVVSEDKLETEVYNYFWNIAMSVVDYHDLKQLDTLQLNSHIEKMASQTINDLRKILQVQEVVGPNEPGLPGEFNINILRKAKFDFEKEYKNIPGLVSVALSNNDKIYAIVNDSYIADILPKVYNSISVEIKKL